MGIKSFGQSTVYTPDGIPALLQANSLAATVCITSKSEDLFRVRRHWSDGGHTTEVCCCEPFCTSSRLDTFAAALRRISVSDWEEVLLIMSEQGMHSLLLQVSQRTKGEQIEGALFKLQRHGDKANGRVVITLDSMLKTFPPPFELHRAILKKLGLSPSFFGIVEPERTQEPVSRGSAQNGKPRLPLGAPQKGK